MHLLTILKWISIDIVSIKYRSFDFTNTHNKESDDWHIAGSLLGSESLGYNLLLGDGRCRFGKIEPSTVFFLANF